MKIEAIANITVTRTASNRRSITSPSGARNMMPKAAPSWVSAGIHLMACWETENVRAMSASRGWQK